MARILFYRNHCSMFIFLSLLVYKIPCYSDSPAWSTSKMRYNIPIAWCCFVKLANYKVRIILTMKIFYFNRFIAYLSVMLLKSLSKLVLLKFLLWYFYRERLLCYHNRGVYRRGVKNIIFPATKHLFYLYNSFDIRLGRHIYGSSDTSSCHPGGIIKKLRKPKIAYLKHSFVH